MCLFQTRTDVYGRYSIGPLRDEETFIVKAHSIGHVIDMDLSSFSESGTTRVANFIARRLGEIQVEVTDLVTGLPLNGVLLSMSGNGGYRATNVTDLQGSVAFVGLSSSIVHLRPILKEYRFEPSSLDLNIQVQDQDVNVILFLCGY